MLHIPVQQMGLYYILNSSLRYLINARLPNSVIVMPSFFVVLVIFRYSAGRMVMCTRMSGISGFDFFLGIVWLLI